MTGFTEMDGSKNQSNTKHKPKTKESSRKKLQTKILLSKNKKQGTIFKNIWY